MLSHVESCVDPCFAQEAGWSARGAEAHVCWRGTIFWDARIGSRFRSGLASEHLGVFNISQPHSVIHHHFLINMAIWRVYPAFRHIQMAQSCPIMPNLGSKFLAKNHWSRSENVLKHDNNHRFFTFIHGPIFLNVSIYIYISIYIYLYIYIFVYIYIHIPQSGLIFFCDSSVLTHTVMDD